MVAGVPGESKVEIRLSDGTLIRALADRLVRSSGGFGTARVEELFFRHVVGVAVTRQNGVGLGVLVGLLFLILAGYLYVAEPAYRGASFGALALAILAPIVGYFIRTQVYVLFSPGWPGGKWEIPAGGDKGGNLLTAIREGCGKGNS